jgi:hypothetical protein
MSERLATALRETAESTPAYDVLDGAIALGRRRRRRRLLGSSAAFMAVLALMAVVAVPVFAPGEVAPGSAAAAGQPWTGPALPERIGVPGSFVAGVDGSPPGAAAVIFMESNVAVKGGGRIVTVGAVDDTYRALESAYADPGRTALLSPTGDRIAYTVDGSVAVADLHTGATEQFVAPDGRSDTASPAAWLPNGNGLIVTTISYAQDPQTEGITKRLSELDFATGSGKQFAEATWPIAPDGFAVAVSQDGSRIAYQYSDFVTIYDRARASKQVFTLPDRAFLAGKGAWTPDGRTIAVIQRDVTLFEARRWQMLLLDPATGQERDPTNRPAMSGVSLIRLLGWDSRTGKPVVAGYQADTTPDGGEFALGENTVTPDQVRRVGVYELAPTGVRTLLQPVDGISGIDVADIVTASGLTRPGKLPPTTPSWVPAAVTLAAIVLGVLILLLLFRFRSRSRRALP